jgi:hypothetical protein
VGNIVTEVNILPPHRDSFAGSVSCAGEITGYVWQVLRNGDRIGIEQFKYRQRLRWVALMQHMPPDRH